MGDATDKNLLLEGLRADDPRWASRLARFRRSFSQQRDWATYSVIDESAQNRPERRRAARVPARLASGKLLDARGEFLTECAYRNRTAAGVRLKLARNVAIPHQLQLYDDHNRDLQWLEVVWRGDGEIGCKITARRANADRRLLSRFGQPYYAIK
jgi:hypothetical protein